jgi:isoleucyl-tRNA synthetase
VPSELRFLFIVSELRLHPLAEKPGDAVKADGVEAWIVTRATTQAKCIRCWHYPRRCRRASRTPPKSAVVA